MSSLWNWLFRRKREVIAESAHSRVCVDRNKARVYKEVFDTAMFLHEESMIRFMQDKSKHVVPLLFSHPGRRTLVIPQADQDLFGWLYEDQAVREMDADDKNEILRDYLLQIIQGVYDLYVNRVEHYDLKPQNILLFADGSAKLTDFGCAVHRGTAYRRWRGSFAYMAPELTVQRPTTAYVPHSMDVYSLCVMLVYILFPNLLVPRYEPLSPQEYRELRERAIELFALHHTDPNLSSLLLWGLEPDPSLRVPMPLLLHRILKCL